MPKPLHFVIANDQFASITDYGYLRVKKSGEVIGRGDWSGFQLPIRAGRFTLNGKQAKTTRKGNDLLFGEPAPADIPTVAVAGECPFPATIAPSGPLHMFARGRRDAALEIKNTTGKPLSGHVEFSTPAGVEITPARLEFKSVAPGESAALPFTVTTGDPAKGKQTLTYRVFWTTDDSAPTRSADQPLVVYAGPTLVKEYANRQANYVLHSPKMTARFAMFNGLCSHLADDDGTVRLDGSPLFTMSDGETPLLFEKQKAGYTWPIEAPANIIGDAEKHKCRWQAFFYGGRMSVRLIPEWSRLERAAHFEIPGRGKSPGGPPRWKRIVGVDEKGKESDVRPGTKLKVTAAELEFPGGKWNLAFQFQPPQHVTFEGTGMKFSVYSYTKENWQLGFVRPDGFDAWRGKKKKKSARVKKQPVDIHVKAGDGRAVQSAIDKAAEAGGGTVHLLSLIHI